MPIDEISEPVEIVIDSVFVYTDTTGVDPEYQTFPRDCNRPHFVASDVEVVEEAKKGKPLKFNADRTKVLKLTQTDKDARKLAADSDKARKVRDAALKDSDSLVIDDMPLKKLSKQDIKDYRKALRDWPESAGFPDLATMPVSPEA